LEKNQKDLEYDKLQDQHDLEEYKSSYKTRMNFKDNNEKNSFLAQNLIDENDSELKRILPI